MHMKCNDSSTEILVASPASWAGGQASEKMDFKLVELHTVHSST